MKQNDITEELSIINWILDKRGKIIYKQSGEEKTHMRTEKTKWVGRATAFWPQTDQ